MRTTLNIDDEIMKFVMQETKAGTEAAQSDARWKSFYSEGK
jgi:hypothetical protein